MKNNRYLWIVAALILILIVIVSLNSGSIREFIAAQIQEYGLAGVLIFSFIADLLDQPIGPEVPAGIALVFGLNFWYVFVFTLIGSYTASFLNFYFAEKFLSKRVSCDNKKYSKYCRTFRKYGSLSLFLSAVSPVPWVMFVWISGSFKMRLWKFVVFGIIPRTFRIGIAMLVVDSIVGLLI
jgi:membrane protein YqaA with SNARE-associated domain